MNISSHGSLSVYGSLPIELDFVEINLADNSSWWLLGGNSEQSTYGPMTALMQYDNFLEQATIVINHFPGKNHNNYRSRIHSSYLPSSTIHTIVKLRGLLEEVILSAFKLPQKIMIIKLKKKQLKVAQFSTSEKRKKFGFLM